MNIIESRYLKSIEAVAAILLIIYPSAMFAVKGGMNASFLFLLLISLSVLIFRPREMSPVLWDANTKIFLFAMAALPAAIFISQSYHQNYSSHPYDAASRFLLAVPIYMVLRRINFKVVTLVQYGLPLAAIVGCLMIKPIALGRYGIATLDLIHFGNFELLLGVLSIASLNWAGHDATLIKTLKVTGLLAGMYASIMSGSRGGWIALPVFLLIFLYFKAGKISFKILFITPMVLVMAGVFVYTLSEKVHHRIDEVTGDISEFRHGNSDTPTGIRFQLFQAATVIALQNPIFGAGTEGFAAAMNAMQKNGTVTPMAAELGRGEVHNEFLSRAAGLGIFGVIALLSIYLVPGRIFYCAMRTDAKKIRQAGMLGLIFVSGFMVFGLTAETLNLTMVTAFYSMTVAVLLAACLNLSEQVSPNTL